MKTLCSESVCEADKFFPLLSGVSNNLIMWPKMQFKKAKQTTSERIEESISAVLADNIPKFQISKGSKHFD